ncbi:MAG: tetratricopeptide repeat protein [Methylocella sp.]
MQAGVQRTAAGLLVAVLVAVASPLRAGDREARRAFDAGRFAEARHLWLPLAGTGDAEAALNLGLLYDLGRGVPRDSAMAYHWYRQAAEAGLTQAAFNVAVMLDSGDGAPRDSAEAALWYARAAAGGHHRAQYALAQLYAAGDGVPRNPATAEVWYRAAARGGLVAASARLSALAQAGRAASPPPRGDVSPVRPVPVAPVDVVLPAGQSQSKVALVWNTPEQPVAVEYYVELRALDVSGSREVSASYVEASATLVELPSAPQRYAWRVYAVAKPGAHYASSAWNSFSIGKAGAN